MRFGALCLSAFFILVPGRAAAQVGRDGELIESSDYAVDASEGAITGGTRFVGLAGAFVALAQGAEGVAHNPAAPAVRVPYSRHRWDYGASVGFSFAGWLPETDFLNRGTGDEGPEVRQKSLLFGSLAANVYYRLAGFGVSAEARRQALERRDAQAGFALTSLTANYGVLNASLGYGLFEGQWVLGAGPRVTGFSLNGADLGSNLVSVRGVGAQVGTVVKPTDQAWRIGMAAKSAVNPSTGASGQQDVGEDPLWRPKSMQLPWEVVAGAAYQFGPRPFNPPFLSVEEHAQTLKASLEHNLDVQKQQLAEARAVAQRQGDEPSLRRVRELEARVETSQTLLDQAELQADVELRRRYHAYPRHYLLVSAALMVRGSTQDSVGVGSVVRGVVERSRDTVRLSPRLGIEGEALAERLVLRGGSYLEPATAIASNHRLHGTFGCDVKLFHWSVFGLIDEFDALMASAAVDGAKNYLNTSVSVGFWH